MANKTELETVEERLALAESLLSRAYSVLDDVHCSETKVARQISEYLYGEDDE